MVCHQLGERGELEVLYQNLPTPSTIKGFAKIEHTCLDPWNDLGP
jgi:hypothetical protein